MDGRTYTYYQATQAQRRKEREIRALKRERAAYEAAGWKDLDRDTERKIRIKTAEYMDFSADLGIRAKTERLRVCEGSATEGLQEVKQRGIMAASYTSGGGSVNYICKIDKRIYECVSNDISTNEVVITDKQIEHSNLHKGAYTRYQEFVEQTLRSPDYIFADKHPNTGLVVKRLPDADGKSLEIVLRIKVSTDPNEYKNSIISCWDISDARLKNYVRNKKILYKADGL